MNRNSTKKIGIIGGISGLTAAVLLKANLKLFADKKLHQSIKVY